MDRKKIFNDLVNYFSALYPHLNGKQRKVAEEWKLIKYIKDENQFLNAVAVAKMKKNRKDRCMAERRGNSKLLFANVKHKAPRVEINSTSSIESDSDLCGSPSLPTNESEPSIAPLAEGNNEKALSSASKSLPKPKQEELKAKISLEKDILLGLHRKRDTGVLSEHDRAELKSRDTT